MSVIDLPSFKISEAVQRGQDVFEVLFENWGSYNHVAPDYTNLSYTNLSYPSPGKPGIDISLAGIALGPRSTVDRAWVSFNLQKNPTLLGSTGEAPASADRLRRLSLDTPLYFSQGGKIGTAKYATIPTTPDSGVIQQFSQGLLYVYTSNRFLLGSSRAYDAGVIGETTILPLTYRDFAGLSQNLGPSPGVAGFETPFLHLYLYLKPPIVPAPAKRFPMQRYGQPPLIDGVSTILTQLPIFGRKHVRICARSTQALAIRTSLLRNIQPTALTTFETDSQTDTAIANAVAEITYDDPCADYLTMIATVTGGNATVNYTVTAYD